MTQAASRKSDLGVRALSAVVMIAVAGTALWIGGWWFVALVAMVSLGVLWEWVGLVRGYSSTALRRSFWIIGGVGYVALAACTLIFSMGRLEGYGFVLLIIGAVIGTDVGAYLAGRGIGGPKIAPSISPSKTWAGLFGGMLGSSLALALIASAWDSGLCDVFYPGTTEFGFDGPCSGYIRMYPVPHLFPWAATAGSLIAIVAQFGDFFESWMKRRAGVKDSGNLIPGHGGLFDRVDGLLAVSFVLGILTLFGQ